MAPYKPNPHALGYGIVALLFLASTGLVFAVYSIATAWEVENYDRVMFGVMLLVGLPLIFIFDANAKWLSQRTGIAQTKLEFFGKAAFFGIALALAGAAEAKGNPTGILWFFGEAIVATAFVGAFVLAWNWAMERFKAWWSKTG